MNSERSHVLKLGNHLKFIIRVIKYSSFVNLDKYSKSRKVRHELCEGKKKGQLNWVFENHQPSAQLVLKFLNTQETCSL